MPEGPTLQILHSPMSSKSCVKMTSKDVPCPRHVLEAANTPSSTPQLPHPDPDLSTCTPDYSCWSACLDALRQAPSFSSSSLVPLALRPLSIALDSKTSMPG